MQKLLFWYRDQQKMAHNLYKLKKRIGYRLKVRHHNGHGIHSPYLYRFITSILQEKHPYYCFDQIESFRQRLYNDPNSDYKRLSKERKCSSDAHCGQIIFRILQGSTYNHLLEIGTFTGLETQYMAMAKPGVRCVSVTKSVELAALAQQGFQEQKLKNVDLQILKPEGDLSTVIKTFEKLDFVLFNRIQDPLEVLRLFNECLLRNKNDSLFVFMDIHANPGMNATWDKIRTNAGVQVSIDAFEFGIVMFNPEIGKKNFVLRTK